MRTKLPPTAEELENKREKAIRKKKDLDLRERRRTLITVSVSAVAVLAIWLFNFFLPFRSLVPAEKISPRTDGELRVHFLDIGQGDATVFEFPEGDCFLFDTGDGSLEHENRLYGYLKGLSPTSLTVILTHGDLDHSGGLSFLFQHCPPDAVYLPVSSSYVPTGDVPVFTYSRYDVLTGSGGGYAVCLSPYSVEERSGNDASGVFYINYRETVFLVCGDISSVRERRLMRDYALDETIFDAGGYRVRLEDVDILKVAHHGSATSSSAEWISLLSPQISVISCGAGNIYDHPTSKALQSIGSVSEIYRTDELGDIVISVNADGYSVES